MLRRRTSLLSFGILVLALLAVACDDGGGDSSQSCVDDADCLNGFRCVALQDGQRACVAEDDASDTAETSEELDAEEAELELEDEVEEIPWVCDEGTLRCSIDENVERCAANTYVSEEDCEYGCEAAACLAEPRQGTCSEPIPIAIGEAVWSTTETLYNPNNWTAECVSSYGYPALGPETVFALDLDEPTYVNIKVTPRDLIYFGLYIRGECEDQTAQAHSICLGNASPGASGSYEGLLGAGRHYIIVDDFALSSHAPGIFKLELSEALRPACGGQIPVVLDPTTPVSITGNTALGADAEEWNEYHCPADGIQSTGSENIYQFALLRPERVAVAVTPLEPSDSRVGVYLRTECETRFSQVACGYTVGETAASFEADLEAGAYSLFVDDFSAGIDEAQSYQLELWVVE